MPVPKTTPIEANTPNDISEDPELTRLKEDIYRPDKEKLMLFTKMLRINALYKRAKITHK